MRRLALAFALYLAIFWAAAIWRWHIWTFGADTGTFAQVVAHTFSGFSDGPEQGTHFRFHWAPLLALLYPLVAITRSPLSLQLAQVFLVGLAALPLYGIARAYLDERHAAALASLALLYPPLLGIAFDEFHEDAFFPVLALALVWAAERERWRWFALFAVLSALVREDVCVTLVPIGLALAAVHPVTAFLAMG
ncbi:MAG: DUF2079 domain-containing protein, partial [Candidatus Dormibacteria bacterium]